MSDDVSIITGRTKTFSVADFILFAAVLIGSAIIGLYFAWTGRKNVTIKDYMLAGGNMKTLPVALSLIASFMSAITLLGVPVEMYQFSTMYVYISIGYILVMIAAAKIYIPIFYLLGVTSTFEYLEQRFDRIVRTSGSVLYVFQMIMYMAVVLYAPALALNAVTGFPLWGAVGSVGAVCTIYTAFGGMKGVLWTDVFQVVMMMAGYLAILIKGSMEVGGFARARRILDENHRVIFDDFSTDPTVRHSFWSLVIGGYFTWVAIYGVNQAMVQRACSLPTLRKAQIAFLLNGPGLCAILLLGCLIGVVMFAFYSHCDPKAAGLITSQDQILPLFVMDVLGNVSGLPGLFVACLFSGALSTLSSGLNALAAVVLQDVIKSYFIKDMTDVFATRVSQALALFFGCVCLALTVVAAMLGNMLQAALSLFGMLAGPLFSMFTLGMLFPMANKWGALAGLFSSVLLTFTIGIGNFVTHPPIKPAPAPVTTDGCVFNVTKPDVTIKANGSIALFGLSYLWYGASALITTIVVGLTVSFITGRQKAELVDPRLICPIFDILPPFCFLPESIRVPLRFGVVHDGKYDKAERKMTITKRLSELEALEYVTIHDVWDQTLSISSPLELSSNDIPKAAATMADTTSDKQTVLTEIGSTA